MAMSMFRRLAKRTGKKLFKTNPFKDSSFVPIKRVDFKSTSNKAIRGGSKEIHLSNTVQNPGDVNRSRIAAKLDTMRKKTKLDGKEKSGLLRRAGAKLLRFTPAATTLAAIGVGAGVGMYKGAVNRADERTRHMTKRRPMHPGHLGTDGLTLALSRQRHG